MGERVGGVTALVRDRSRGTWHHAPVTSVAVKARRVLVAIGQAWKEEDGTNRDK